MKARKLSGRRTNGPPRPAVQKRRDLWRERQPTLPQKVCYTPIGPVMMSWGDARGYKAIATIRESGATPAVGGSADYQLDLDFERMREESQRFDRNNGIYSAMISRVIDVMLGDGLTLQARTANARTNQRLDDLWKEYWHGEPEVRGLDDGSALERLFFRHLFVDGDFGQIKNPEDGKIQFIESERITSVASQSPAGNRIFCGVELDKRDKPLAYYVADYDSYGQVVADSKRIEAKDFIFLPYRQRVSQTRGLPVQQVNFAMFHRINDVCDSEAIAWQLLTKMAIAIIKADAEAVAGEISTPDESASAQDLARRIVDVGEGLIVNLKPGEDIKGIERNIPGLNFTESIKTFMRFLGLPFGFPLEFTLLIWSDTNYSSGRAGIKQAERSCKPWLKLLMRRAMTPIYTWQVQRWLAAGKIRPRGDIFKHRWHAEPYPFIDPHKERQGQREGLEAGLTSPTREGKAVGLDDAELVEEQKQDLLRRAEAAEAINKKHPSENLTSADFTAFVPRKKARETAGAGTS